MAIDDFLAKYYERYQKKSDNVPKLLSSINSAPYGNTLQGKIGLSANKAAEDYGNVRTKSSIRVAADMADKSAGQIPVDENGIVQKQSPLFPTTSKFNLKSIGERGSIATAGEESKAQWQQAKKLQDLYSNYNVSTVFGANYDPQLIPPGATSNSKGAQALAIAMTALKNGTPYVWGGNSLVNGVDCSGLVQQAYSKLGIKLPRSTYEQAKAGQVVSVGNALPGDLVFYNTGSRDPNGIGTYGHVGIYMGNGKILEAANSKAGIRTSSINGSNGAPSLVIRPWS
jgi:cell wall-associated NlpC family hydrolase